MCSRRGSLISLDAFAERLGSHIPVEPDEGAAGHDVPGAIAVLGAEVALLQARLDEVQRELARLTSRATPGRTDGTGLTRPD